MKTFKAMIKNCTHISFKVRNKNLSTQTFATYLFSVCGTPISRNKCGIKKQFKVLIVPTLCGFCRAACISLACINKMGYNSAGSSG